MISSLIRLNYRLLKRITYSTFGLITFCVIRERLGLLETRGYINKIFKKMKKNFYARSRFCDGVLSSVLSSVVSAVFGESIFLDEERLDLTLEIAS